MSLTDETAYAIVSSDRLGWYDFPVSAQVKLLKATHDRELVIVAMKFSHQERLVLSQFSYLFISIMKFILKFWKWKIRTFLYIRKRYSDRNRRWHIFF